MFLAEAEAIRKLISADTKARNALGGVPFTKDLVAELNNAERFQSGKTIPNRQRSRLGMVVRNSHGEIIGYMGISILQQARPTAYEQKHIWYHKRVQTISGIFIRRIMVKESERGNGLGAILLHEASGLAKVHALSLFCDTMASNLRMRAFLRDNNAKEDLFWVTPRGTFMVRHAWRETQKQVRT